MCLPVPAVEDDEEVSQDRKLFTVDIAEWRLFGLFADSAVNVCRTCAQRCALGRLGGALPRTPASFRLSWLRFAGLLWLG